MLNALNSILSNHKIQLFKKNLLHFTLRVMEVRGVAVQQWSLVTLLLMAKSAMTTTYSTKIADLLLCKQLLVVPLQSPILCLSVFL